MEFEGAFFGWFKFDSIFAGMGVVSKIHASVSMHLQKLCTVYWLFSEGKGKKKILGTFGCFRYGSKTCSFFKERSFSSDALIGS